MILAGDIGGTNTRLAYFDDEAAPTSIEAPEVYSSREFRRLASIVEDFLHHNTRAIDGAAFGVAGPVRDGRTARLTKRGHRIIATDRNADAVRSALESGAIGAASLRELVGQLAAPRAVWIMVPAGDPTESEVNEVNELSGLLSASTWSSTTPRTSKPSPSPKPTSGSSSTRSKGTRRSSFEATASSFRGSSSIPSSNGWARNDAPPLEIYDRGSWEPRTDDELLGRDGRSWQSGCRQH